jgi:hypothetical protein
MPAWDMPDRQIWQLVAYIRSLPIVAHLDAGTTTTVQTGPVANAHYVGSAACPTCHQDTFTPAGANRGWRT